MKPTLEHSSSTVARWHHCAVKYVELTQKYDIFSRLADRLIDFLPEDFFGVAFDIAAGSGLVSKRLLNRCPEAQIVLIEPAAAMLKEACASVGQRALGGFALRAEQVDAVPFHAEAALCSAALHLMEEAAVLRAVSQKLAPGGVFACNLWWHSFAETACLKPPFSWQEPVAQVLREEGLPVPSWTRSLEPRAHTRAKLSAAARAVGIPLRTVAIDEDEIPKSFFIDFAAMSAQWLAHLAPDVREHILRRAVELASGSVTVQTVRFHFVKE